MIVVWHLGITCVYSGTFVMFMPVLGQTLGIDNYWYISIPVDVSAFTISHVFFYTSYSIISLIVFWCNLIHWVISINSIIVLFLLFIIV